MQGAARSLKKYACPICTALKGHPGDLDAAIGRTKRTRSVSLTATQCVHGLCLICWVLHMLYMMHTCIDFLQRKSVYHLFASKVLGP